MKRDKAIYWASTGLLCLMMLGSAGMYFFNYGEVSKVVSGLGFPVFIIYPLGVAKVLGVIAVLSRKSALLKDLAYAGFFYNFLLAAGAHINVGDGEAGGAIVALVLLITSFIFERKVFGDR